MYRQEHPKPQFRRDDWENLNGAWEFAFDDANSGEERGMMKEGASYPLTIEVPFCPESKLSGIADTDFHTSVWYRRNFTVSAPHTQGRTVLHFGASDYRTTVYVNGKTVGTHVGGYVSFSFDVSAYVTEGENTLVVHAFDDVRSRHQPSGKQSEKYASYGCLYTRTTGIWQTVFLEYTPKTYIRRFRLLPDAKTGVLSLHAEVVGKGVLSATASFDGTPEGSASAVCEGGQISLTIPLFESRLWELGRGGLYDLTLTYGDDVVHSYFGLRSSEFIGNAYLLNGKKVFQRLVLDQGFYPDGIYTAPTDADLEADICRSMAMGFNGARLHEKVFEERFLYHADRLGYLVWGEYPNWGLDVSYADALEDMLPEWLDEIERDANHPSLIGWCPFNETWDQNGRQQRDGVLSCIYRATKAADPTRPCIDTSGNYHVVTDVYDIHDYCDAPETYRETFASLAENGTFRDRFEPRQSYTPGMPFFVSEYGGIGWVKGSGVGGGCSSESWGYGKVSGTEEAFLTRLRGLTDVLLDNPNICAYCYTQLTDVEQEQNGLYTYDREPKFPPEVIHDIFARKAAIED